MCERLATKPYNIVQISGNDPVMIHCEVSPEARACPGQLGHRKLFFCGLFCLAQAAVIRDTKGISELFVIKLILSGKISFIRGSSETIESYL